MIVTVQKDTKRIYDAVSTAAELGKPGMGIGYVTSEGGQAAALVVFWAPPHALERLRRVVQMTRFVLFDHMS